MRPGEIAIDGIRKGHSNTIEIRVLLSKRFDLTHNWPGQQHTERVVETVHITTRLLGNTLNFTGLEVWGIAVSSYQSTVNPLRNLCIKKRSAIGHVHGRQLAEMINLCRFRNQR